MTKEDYVKSIREKIKKTVNENNYKLALAITGHRPGKIRDVVLASQEGEALLDYIDQQDQIIREAREYVENHSLYEEEYDYDYEENIYLSGIDDETAKKELLEILDRNVK